MLYNVITSLFRQSCALCSASFSRQRWPFALFAVRPLHCLHKVHKVIVCCTEVRSCSSSMRCTSREQLLAWDLCKKHSLLLIRTHVSKHLDWIYAACNDSVKQAVAHVHKQGLNGSYTIVTVILGPFAWLGLARMLCSAEATLWDDPWDPLSSPVQLQATPDMT
jgi:hypothetical protein